MANSAPDDASSGLRDLRTSMSFERNGDRINVRVGDFVEVFAGDNLPYIARVAMIGKDDQGEVVAKMQWFYRQSEIPAAMKKRLGRKFEKNEVFLSTHLDFNAVESVLNSVKIQFVDNEGKSFISRGEGDQMGGPKYVCSCDYNVGEDRISPLSAEKVRWLRKTHNNSESGDGDEATASRKLVSRTNSVMSGGDKNDHSTQAKDNKDGQTKVEAEKLSTPKSDDLKSKNSQGGDSKSKSSKQDVSKDTKPTIPEEKTESNTNSVSTPQAKRQRVMDINSDSSSSAPIRKPQKKGKGEDQSKKKSRVVMSSSSSSEASDGESTAADDDDLNSVATMKSSSDAANEKKPNASRGESAVEPKKKVNEKDDAKPKDIKMSSEKSGENAVGEAFKQSSTDKTALSEKKKQETISAALANIQNSLGVEITKPQAKTGDSSAKSVKAVVAAEEKRKDVDVKTKKAEQPKPPAKAPESRPVKDEPIKRPISVASTDSKSKRDSIEPKGEDGKPAKQKSVAISEHESKAMRQPIAQSQANQQVKPKENDGTTSTTNVVKQASDGVVPVRPKTPLSDTSLSTDGDEFIKNVTPSSKSRSDSANKRMSEAKKSIRAPDPYLHPKADDEAVYRALIPEASMIEQDYPGMAMSKDGRKSPTPPPERPSSSRRRRAKDDRLSPEDELDNARLHLQPHGAIRIGSEYQAVLPAYIGVKPPQPTCNAQLVSKPSSASSLPQVSITERCSRRGSVLALALSEPSSPNEEERKRVLWVRVCEPINSEGNVRVCPFDVCWPKVQGKPESFVVPKSTMMMMAPSKSFIQSDAFPGSLASSPGDTIATWSEQEYIAFCEALKKVKPNTQITTLLANAVKTKTPTEVVEMFWIPRRGIGNAPHILVSCSKCSASRVPLVSCKSYFMCRSVVCEKCFKDMHGKLVESDRESDVLSLFQRAKYGHWFCKTCVKRPASSAEALPSKPESTTSTPSVAPSTNKLSSANVENKPGSTMAISAVVGNKQPNVVGTQGKVETAAVAPFPKGVTPSEPEAGPTVSDAKKQNSDATTNPVVASIISPAPTIASNQNIVNDSLKAGGSLSTAGVQATPAQVAAVSDTKPHTQQVLAKTGPAAGTVTMSVQAAAELEEADTIADVIQLHDAGKVSPEDALERIRAILVTEAKKNLELAMLLAKAKGK